MNTLPGHAAGPTKHGVHVDQEGAVPVLLQNAPTTFDRVVLAVVGRIVEELDGLPDMVGEFHHALEELSTSAIAFGPVVGLDLESGEVAILGRQVIPPVIQTIDDEVAGLGRIAEDQVELSAVFIHDPEGRTFFLAAHVVIGSLVISPGRAAPGILPNFYRGFAVDGQALDGTVFGTLSVLGSDVGEDGIGLRDFFWGLALTTGRSR